MVYPEPVSNAIASHLMFVTDWEHNVLSFCLSFKETGFWQHTPLLTSDCLTSPKTNIFQAKNATHTLAEMCTAGSTTHVLWRTPLQCTGITLI